MNISPPVAAWSYFWLKKEFKGIPSARTYTPYYNADSWDLDDLFSSFQEEALVYLPVGQIITDRLEGKKWPRLRTKEAFWIRERWGFAQSFCCDLMQPIIRPDRTVASSKPDDPAQLLNWLLSEKWETEFADQWCKENARSHIFVEDHSFPDRAIELEIFMRKLEGKL